MNTTSSDYRPHHRWLSYRSAPACKPALVKTGEIAALLDRRQQSRQQFSFWEYRSKFDISGCPEVVDMTKSNNNCHQTVGGILALAGKAKRNCRFDRATPVQLSSGGIK